jgi:hypothetical protein
MKHFVAIKGSMEHCSAVYRWCRDRWPNNDGWHILAEIIQWETGGIKVVYEFEHKDNAVLFSLVWLDAA